MELQEILSALESNIGTFPRLALEQAIKQKEAITPVLLERFEECINSPKALVENASYMLHIYTLYLLAQFREAKAYPLMVRFFSMPDQIALDTTGDVVTESLGRMLASVSHGDIEPLKQLIENPNIDEYVKGAALQTFMILVAKDVISREEVLPYFEGVLSALLEQEIEKEDSYFVSDLVLNTLRLCPAEITEPIERAFQADLVDPWLVSRKDAEQYLQLGPEAVLNELKSDRNFSFVEDTISEMEWWACFRQEKERDSKPTRIPPALQEFAAAPARKPVKKAKAKRKRTLQKQSRRQNRAKKKK
jgi:hypothetical protein